MMLPTKSKRYEYHRYVQTDAWNKWFNMRIQENIIIKMNIGSGNTVIGLMILQGLNKEKEFAIYIVLDNF